MYNLFRPLLFSVDPEKAHNTLMTSLSTLGMLMPPGSPLPPGPLSQTIWGIHFPTPVGLAAGFDKNGRATKPLSKLGFGHIEVGTVTRYAQEGNSRPRIFRLPEDKSIINRMGFPSEGLDKVVSNLKKRTRKIPIGLNVGLNKEVVQSNDFSQYIEDLATCITSARGLADYFVLNCSSPNTVGLRDLLAPDFIAAIYTNLKEHMTRTGIGSPLLVKISPDIGVSGLGMLGSALADVNVDGIVAINTTVSRNGLTTETTETGGLSGEVIKDRSYEVLSHLRTVIGPQIPIISVGGISTAEDVYSRVLAGANLVQIYSSMVFEGPNIVRRINKDLLDILGLVGASSILEVAQR